MVPITECDYIYINYMDYKLVTYTKTSPKMLNPRDIAGTAEEGEEENMVPTCPV